MRLYTIAAAAVLILLTACSSGGFLKKKERSDIVALVLKNYEPDFRYCQDMDKPSEKPVKEKKYTVDFVLLPSGMVYSSKITKDGGQSSKGTQCMEKIMDRIIFPPVMDQKTKNIKREFLFTEETQE